jgi:hypothetical protein
MKITEFVNFHLQEAVKHAPSIIHKDQDNENNRKAFYIFFRSLKITKLYKTII